MGFSPRKTTVTAAAAVGVLLGAAGLAAATTGSGSGSSDAADVPYTSSITAPAHADPQGLATITEQQARDAATSSSNGTVGEVELENEGGNIVFGVEVTKPGGTQLDVKVDAGTGKVLASEPDGDGHDHEGSGAEQDD
jgi:uncharacterized membrane protein YkoI